MWFHIELAKKQMYMLWPNGAISLHTKYINQALRLVSEVNKLKKIL